MRASRMRMRAVPILPYRRSDRRQQSRDGPLTSFTWGRLTDSGKRVSHVDLKTNANRIALYAPVVGAGLRPVPSPPLDRPFSAGHGVHRSERENHRAHRGHRGGAMARFPRSALVVLFSMPSASLW